MLLRPPADVPWAVTFTDPFAAANVGTPLNVPLHPTQVYEAGAELIILIFLLVTERKGRTYPGRTFWGYMLLYAVSRFIIEFYRADERGFVMGLSTSQFISVVLAPLSLFMLVYLRAGRHPSRRKRLGARPEVSFSVSPQGRNDESFCGWNADIPF